MTDQYLLLAALTRPKARSPDCEITPQVVTKAIVQSLKRARKMTCDKAEYLPALKHRRGVLRSIVKMIAAAARLRGIIQAGLDAYCPSQYVLVSGHKLLIIADPADLINTAIGRLQSRGVENGKQTSRKDATVTLLTGVLTSLIAQSGLVEGLRDTLGTDHSVAIGKHVSL